MNLMTRLKSKISGGPDQASRLEEISSWLASEYPKYLSLITLTFQNAVLTLTMRAARTQEQQFSAPIAIILAEVIKLVTCLVLVCYNEGGPTGTLNSLNKNIVQNYVDTSKVSVLAVVYYIQNNLIYIGSTHLDAAISQTTLQIRIFTTAIFSVFILKHKLTNIQWASLATLFVGVALIEVMAVTPTNKDNKPLPKIDVNGRNVEPTDNIHKRKEENPLIGLTAILIACCMSGLSGVYFEKILKNSAEVSLWIRNIQLSLLAIPIGLMQVYALEYDNISRNGVLFGFTPLTWSCVSLQALGGLLVALAIKLANNIQKGFALSLAIVISTILSVFLFNFKLTPIFLLGVSLVIGSVLTYNWPTHDNNNVSISTPTNSNTSDLKCQQNSVTITKITIG